MQNEEYERALEVLLRRPGVDFIHGLSSSLERDPGYLKAHLAAIKMGLKDLLDGAAIFWDRHTVDKHAENLIREALDRLKTTEKEIIAE